MVGCRSFGWEETTVCRVSEEYPNGSGRVVRGGPPGVVYLGYKGGVVFSGREDGRSVYLSSEGGKLEWVPWGLGWCLPRVCLVSITSCNVSDPSFVVDFGMSWCVLT